MWIGSQERRGRGIRARLPLSCLFLAKPVFTRKAEAVCQTGQEKSREWSKDRTRTRMDRDQLVVCPWTFSISALKDSHPRNTLVCRKPGQLGGGSPGMCPPDLAHMPPQL